MEAQLPIGLCSKCHRSFPLDRGVCPDDGQPLMAPGEEGMERGTLLDSRFVILDALGAEHKTAVFRAFDTVDREMRALKIFPSELGGKAGVADAFAAEVQGLIALDHPCLMGVYGSQQADDDRLLLALEYVRGVPLRKFMDPMPVLPLRAMLQIVAQITEGIQHAHGAGVLHGAIAADTILVVRVPNRTTTAKLINFKLASIEGNSGLSKSEEHGAADWNEHDDFPVELLDTDRDIYALGRLLYEIVSSRCINLEQSAHDHQAHRHEALAPMADSLGVPRSFLMCIDQCVKEDPVERPGDVAVVLAQLKLALEALPDLGDNQPKRATLAAVDSQGRSEAVTLQDWHIAEQPTLSSIEDICGDCGVSLARGAVCLNCRRPGAKGPQLVEAIPNFPDDFFDAEPPRVKPTFQALWTASLGVLNVIAREPISRRELRIDLEKVLSATLIRYGCEEVKVVATDEGFRLILIAIDALEGDIDEVMQASAQILLNVVGATIKSLHQSWAGEPTAGICGAVGYGTVAPPGDPDASPDSLIKGTEADFATRLPSLAKPWEVLAPSELFHEEEVVDTLLVPTRERTDDGAETSCAVSVWKATQDSSRFFVEKGS